MLSPTSTTPASKEPPPRLNQRLELHRCGRLPGLQRSDLPPNEPAELLRHDSMGDFELRNLRCHGLLRGVFARHARVQLQLLFPKEALRIEGQHELFRVLSRGRNTVSAGDRRNGREGCAVVKMHLWEVGLRCESRGRFCIEPEGLLESLPGRLWLADLTADSRQQQQLRPTDMIAADALR